MTVDGWMVHGWMDSGCTVKRQKGGGWFSIDVQNCWQGGELDITGEIFENIVNNIIEDGGDPSGYYETTYEKH